MHPEIYGLVVWDNNLRNIYKLINIECMALIRGISAIESESLKLSRIISLNDFSSKQSGRSTMVFNK